MLRAESCFTVKASKPEPKRGLQLGLETLPANSPRYKHMDLQEDSLVYIPEKPARGSFGVQQCWTSTAKKLPQISSSMIRMHGCLVLCVDLLQMQL